MESSELYYIVLLQPEKFDLQALSDLITPILSVPQADITLRLKNSWGLLHSTPSLPEAQNFSDYLTQEGFPVFILPEHELKQLPVPLVLKKAVPEERGLTYEQEGREKNLPWDAVSLLGAGQVIESSSSKKRVIGDGNIAHNIAFTGISFVTAVRISHDRLKGKEVTEKKTSTRFFLDLIANGRAESIRIMGESFNYAFLGSRLGYNVMQNFTNLLNDMISNLPDVLMNQGAQAFQSGQMNKTKYLEARYYASEMLWLRQLVGRTS